MSDDADRVAVWHAYQQSTEKYCYFMLAAVGAAIGFALTQTRDDTLDLTKLLLGLAVLSWGYSFFSGCWSIRYRNGTLGNNVKLLQVKSGTHPLVGVDPTRMEFALASLRDGFEKYASKVQQTSTHQFWGLMLGAVFYILWHVGEMYLRSIS